MSIHVVRVEWCDAQNKKDYTKYSYIQAFAAVILQGVYTFTNYVSLVNDTLRCTITSKGTKVVFITSKQNENVNLVLSSYHTPNTQ